MVSWVLVYLWVDTRIIQHQGHNYLPVNVDLGLPFHLSECSQELQTSSPNISYTHNSPPAVKGVQVKALRVSVQNFSRCWCCWGALSAARVTTGSRVGTVCVPGGCTVCLGSLASPLQSLPGRGVDSCRFLRRSNSLPSVSSLTSMGAGQDSTSEEHFFCDS